jgi:DHA1 family bicyclomycin/chloramphenicol resistance-like MFS transporter
MMGALQFTLAAIASPLVGLAGEESAVPMAIVMLAAGMIALLSLLALTRGGPVQPAAGQAERHLDTAAR